MLRLPARRDSGLPAGEIKYQAGVFVILPGLHSESNPCLRGTTPTMMEGVQVPVPVDDDDPNAEGSREGGSPQKKGRKNDQNITLDMLKEVLAAERTKDRAHLSQSLQEVKGDIDQLRTRMDSVEGGVTQQMNNTLAMLTCITNNYDVQAAALTDLQEGQRGMEQRLQALEKQPPAGSVPARTADRPRKGDDDPPSSWADGTLTSWRQTP